MATTKRTYGDRCGVARALDIVGERWALLVVRELLLGPKRFTDLRAGLPHVGPDVLAQRLRELEASGVRARARTLPPPAGSRVYELTERGQRARARRPRARALGQRRALPAGRGRRSASTPLVIALKTLFAPGAADGLSAGYELRLGEQHFRSAGGRRASRRRPRERPDARRHRRDRARNAGHRPLARPRSRRSAPLRRPRRHRRRGGGQSPHGAVPAALVTLQSCGRARRTAGQSA